MQFQELVLYAYDINQLSLHSFGWWNYWPLRKVKVHFYDHWADEKN